MSTPALTARELQVLELVAKGRRNQQIGKERGIAIGTVKIHIRNVVRKTGAKSRRFLNADGTLNARAQVETRIKKLGPFAVRMYRALCNISPDRRAIGMTQENAINAVAFLLIEIDKEVL